MARQPSANMREEILRRAVPLFARRGFEGVSMRDVATAVGVTPAALYHHFPDKDQLYLDAVEQAFAGKAGPFISVLGGEGSPWDRLEAFILQFARALDDDADFGRLLQWVLLDTDDRRLQRLGYCVFGNLFNALRDLTGEFVPEDGTHLLAVSILGLVIYHFETQPARRFLQGYEEQREGAAVIAGHVVALLRSGLGRTKSGKPAPGSGTNDVGNRRDSRQPAVDGNRPQE